MSKRAGFGTITSVAAGEAIQCSGTTMLNLDIGGTATAGFQLMGPDGTWRTLTDGASNFASSGMWFIDFPNDVQVRLNVSAYTSGDVDWQIASTAP